MTCYETDENVLPLLRESLIYIQQIARKVAIEIIKKIIL